jgi:RHS repeat-associated protein
MMGKMRLSLKAISVSAIGISATFSVAASAGSKPQDTPPQASVASTSPGLVGQSQTMLPDGRVLLLGGVDNGTVVRSVSLRNAKTGEIATPSGVLVFARAFHSATLLPNGKVLIFGGTGAQNSVVSDSEIFDPAKQSLTKLAVQGLAPRAHHTATLLPDGRVLVAGGVDSHGIPLTRIDLWDYRTGISSSLPVELHSARIGQTARLLPDGTVLLQGGNDQNGSPLQNNEIVDPSGPSVRLINAGQNQSVQSLIPSITVTIPQSGESGVPTDQVVSLLFSEPMNVTTLNASTVTLRTFTGAVSVNVVPAEGGMLVFVTPQSPLQNDTTYTVSISGAKDNAGQVLPDSNLVFTTAASDESVTSGGSVNSSGGNGAGWQTTSSPPGVAAGPNTPWRKLPMLPAPAGTTALAGQVLKLDGTPLANVLLEIGPHHATTDNTGRFLIQDLGPGHHMMLVDGGPAGDKSASYGTYRVGVDLQAGRTNLLSYTIWMTALDTAHFVNIPSPTTSDMVITTPSIPGLELHLPAGTVIHDARGKVVTRVGITAIPVKQPPFPLKRGVTFPVYFTIQPGGATFTNVRGPQGAGPNARPKGAQIYYENHFKAAPNTQFEFWNYDPFQRGWYVYGHGHVTSDAKTVAPDQGTQIWSFDGAMLELPNWGSSPNPKGGPGDGDPIDLGTGLFVYTKTDLALNDVIPLSLTRTYRQSDYISRAFGIGNNLNYDMFLLGDNSGTPEGYTFQDLYLADGSKIHFTRTSPCTGTNGYCDYTNAVLTALSTPGPFYGATSRFVVQNIYSLVWLVTLKDGTVLTFPDAEDDSLWQEQAIIGLQDRYGNSLTFTRDASGNLTQIASPNGRWIKFTYGELGANVITEAQDSSGRTTSYTYNTLGYLATSTDANGGVTSYTYDANGNMLTITDPRNIQYIQNQYDVNDMVYQQTLADSGVYQLAYTLDSNSNVTQVSVTDPRSYVRTVAFNSDGYMTSDTRAVGQPETQTTTYNRQEGTGLVLGITDSLSRNTTFTYDAMGDVTGVTQLAGTANAVTTSLTYTPQYYELSSITDPLGNTSSATFDGFGNMLTVSDPLGNTSSLTYNSSGQPITYTDPLGNLTQLGYSTGNLTSVTDPNGRTTSAFIDSATRIAAITDPLGNITRAIYDPLNELTSVTDPLGNQTSYSYDGNGNRLTITDANEHTTSYTYDSMDRPYVRKDALGNSATAQYDLNGNMTQATDRNGNVTTINYDGIDRPTFFGYGTQAGPTYQSTVSNTFDAGNRLTGVSDSITGAISRTYDGLDHVLSETTPQGSVAYTYDLDERRQTMTVSGQSQINYGFDNDSRLTSITQGSATVGFGYDNDSRRTSLALPNGNTAAYNYDAASQLLGIVYQGGALGVANLNYSYDLDGRRIGVSGTLANEILPAAVSSAAYNANNQLTLWGSTAVSYDLSGNTLDDGTNTYTWDARNQLVSANSGGATFGYDPMGRRVSKTLLSTTSNFLYDGPNAVQEQNGSGVTANLLTGGVDERLQRTDSTGTYEYLTDALGSTMAMTSSTGAEQTIYGYSPFGALSATGTNSNDYTYTGREADGLGIYYYRARYYNPQIERFLSEDPMGFAGSGPDLYAYVGDSPVNFSDPTGWATYVTNRLIGGGPSLPWWVLISHTFTFSTNPDGSIAATYSWGNSANPNGWNFDQPEDIAAAMQALQNGDAQQVGDSNMDPSYQQAFDQLNNPANKHLNLVVGRNCKTENKKLRQLAQQLYWSNLIQQWWQNFWQQVFGDSF